jgi:hypothetical protein
MADRYPAVNACSASHRFDVGNRLIQVVRPTLGASDTSGLRIPCPHPARRQIVMLEVVDTAGSAGQNHDIWPLSGDTDVQQGSIIGGDPQRSHRTRSAHQSTPGVDLTAFTLIFTPCRTDDGRRRLLRCRFSNLTSSARARRGPSGRGCRRDNVSNGHCAGLCPSRARADRAPGRPRESLCVRRDVAQGYVHARWCTSHP